MLKSQYLHVHAKARVKWAIAGVGNGPNKCTYTPAAFKPACKALLEYNLINAYLYP